MVSSGALCLLVALPPFSAPLPFRFYRFDVGGFFFSPGWLRITLSGRATSFLDSPFIFFIIFGVNLFSTGNDSLAVFGCLPFV